MSTHWCLVLCIGSTSWAQRVRSSCRHDVAWCATRDGCRQALFGSSSSHIHTECAGLIHTHANRYPRTRTHKRCTIVTLDNSQRTTPPGLASPPVSPRSDPRTESVMAPAAAPATAMPAMFIVGKVVAASRLLVAGCCPPSIPNTHSYSSLLPAQAQTVAAEDLRLPKITGQTHKHRCCLILWYHKHTLTQMYTAPPLPVPQLQLQLRLSQLGRKLLLCPTADSSTNEPTNRRPTTQTTQTPKNPLLPPLQSKALQTGAVAHQ